MPSYILSEPYKQRVDRALSVVEGQPSQGGITRIPTRFESLQQQSENPIRLAAYPRDLDWKKGQTAQITLYTHSGTAYGPVLQGSGISATMVTATALNVSHDLGLINPADKTPDAGPTPTMTWCIVGRRNGVDMLIEGPDQPQVGLATISPTSIGDVWAKGDSRTVVSTASGGTVTVINTLDAHTKLDFPNGLVYATSVNPANTQQTAHVVVGPPAIPLHSATYTQSEWPRGQSKTLTVPPAGGRTFSVQVQVTNDFYDNVDASEAGKVAIGRFGTSFSVISSPPASSITPGTLVTPIAQNERWDVGSVRSVRISGTTTQVDVVNPFEELTTLDARRGVLFARSQRNPTGGGGTANVLISPAPKELFEARFSQGNVGEEWPRGQTKQLVVPAGGGRPSELIVPVVNKFFESFSPGTAAMAIGKIDGEFCVLSKPHESSGQVTPGTLVTPIANGEQWEKGSVRSVYITGSTTQVDVVNPFDELTHLECKEGILFAESSRDPLGGQGTTNVLISPAPKEIYQAYSSSSGEWNRGQTKTLMVPPGDGRVSATPVTVSNTFFDNFSLTAQQSVAIGKIGASFHLLTGGGSQDVKMVDRTDNQEWLHGSQRQVRVHGTTQTLDAINLAGDYEAWDAKREAQGPHMLAVRGGGLGASGGTQWYVVAPPPLEFDSGTWDGKWAKNEPRAFYLSSNGQSVQAANSLFDLPAGGSGAVAKTQGQWKLVSVALETAKITMVQQVQELPYASAVQARSVVTDVAVSGEIKQSAASPVSLGLTVTTQTFSRVTGVAANATLSQSAGNAVTIGATLNTTSVTVLDDIMITATLNTASCAISVNKSKVTKPITVASGVDVQAALDLSKLNVTVNVTATTSNLTVVTGVAAVAEFDVSKLYVELDVTATTTNVYVVQATALGRFVGNTQTATVLRFPGA